MMCLDYWKDAKGYEDKYSGSYWGNVRSWGWYVKHWKGGKRLIKGRLLKTNLCGGGYLTVDFCNGRGKVKKSVHRLIAEAFIKNPNNYKEINHKNGNKADNRVENLEWCSRSHNMKHAYENGLSSQIGEKNSCSKLTERQAKEIKARLLQGQRNVDLAKSYGVGRNVISNIKTGRCWTHI